MVKLLIIIGTIILIYGLSAFRGDVTTIDEPFYKFIAIFVGIILIIMFLVN